jgi:hypothetical protein
MSKPINLFLATSLLFFVSCSSKKGSEKKESKDSTQQSSSADSKQADTQPIVASDADRTWDTVAYETLVARLPALDFDQDLSKKSLEELRILKNTIPARHGYLFMDADLRYYFYQTAWYQKLMEARWYGDCEYSGMKKAPPIAYSNQESAFLEKVTKFEKQKLSENYIKRNGKLYANVKNAVNYWQYENLTDAFKSKLDENGFVIVPSTHTQLFHVYEESDYSQTQNFVTADLYLQLFHMNFSFMLRGLEENNFVPILRDLLSGINNEADALTKKTNGSADEIQFASAFYYIPLKLLGGDAPLAPKFSGPANAELSNIEKLADKPSALLPAYIKEPFPYSIFTPRGHYTRTDTLKMYFKAMQWLQTATFCLENDTDLKRALTAAYILKTGKSKSGTSLLTLYKSILEPTSFIVGQADNVSLLDLCNLIGQKKITSVEKLWDTETIAFVRAELIKLQSTKNVIKPKIELTCPGKINFMPARFLFDNEILQETSDWQKRPFPQGLDVMASIGNQAAEDILVNELKEDRKWDKFLPNLNKMKAKYKNYEDWDASVYNKWIKSLNSLLQPDSRYPSFMQLPSWQKKNLNTALASWAELKHDALLYSERPSGAECGDGGMCAPPPEPYVIGYVEPNVNYWKEALELLSLTEEMLAKYDLLNGNLKFQQEQLKEMCQFLITVSEKELRHENLTEQEYRTIELIGSNVEYITLNIFGTYSWELISGPDKEVAVVADIYNNPSGPQPGLLHAAVGYANDLYVLVEINGYLYLTKGATFSYYEFVREVGEPMTDEEWQEKLRQGKTFAVPVWMNNFILPMKKQITPKVQQKAYSSGC